jgi:hypothetical protein
VLPPDHPVAANGGELRAADGQVRAFATMPTQLTGQDLPQWIGDARAVGLPGLSFFAKGLEQDLDAGRCGRCSRTVLPRAFLGLAGRHRGGNGPQARLNKQRWHLLRRVARVRDRLLIEVRSSPL